ncbi:AIR synthase related protein [Lactobacillus terrae]|uniref:AIR synthase related protein n=1 Tax=Lactobacillus terrae TaxID=2269374 RepID=UPI0014742C01|nr:AIR synthase related protein [Lactobacillus terrae]
MRKYLLAQGAISSSFMDYIAVSKIDSKVNELLKGIIKGCQLADIKLIGGETAEMPGVYSEDIFDIAGFSMGIVEKENYLKKTMLNQGMF